MKSQPGFNVVTNDKIMTPDALAKAIVDHFEPEGHVLEPCCGDGAFLRALGEADWCEIDKGRDFFDWTDKVDWIVTNPPWSQVREFLKRSFAFSDNVVFLLTINHVWTKARINLVRTSGFYLKEIALVQYPKSFPASGFQLGVVHFRRGRWASRPAKIVDLDWEDK